MDTKLKKGMATGATILALGGGVAVTDQQINPYQDKGTHYELSVVSDIPQNDHVEISKDLPEITLSRWNDEARITIKPKFTGAGAISKAKRPLLSKQMQFTHGSQTAFVEPSVTSSDFDIDFSLSSKPTTNVFNYEITGAEDFDFSYQSPLTQEEIEKGKQRPDNVVGSYAVYSKTRANHEVGKTNYATGKIMHIYRPKAIDANGSEVWAELSYLNGILSVTVPQAFLDSAVYPVRVDPTFGYTTLGAGIITGIANLFQLNSSTVGSTYNLASDNLMSSMSAGLYVANSSSQSVDLFFGIYRENSAGDGSHALVASGEGLNVSMDGTHAFQTVNFASESVVADDYILAVLGNAEDLSASEIYLLYDTGGSSRNKYSETTSGAGSYATRKSENPWTESATANTDQYSIYATYTAAGGGGGGGGNASGVIIFDE